MATDNVTQRVIMVKENEKPHRWVCRGLPARQHSACAPAGARDVLFFDSTLAVLQSM